MTESESLTTVAVDREMLDRADRLHPQVTDRPRCEPIRETFDRALDALERELEEDANDE